MNIFFVLAIISLLITLRTFVILKDFIYMLLNNLLKYIIYTKNKFFMRYITLWSVLMIIIFNWDDIWIF